jgi:hypothetical protein
MKAAGRLLLSLALVAVPVAAFPAGTDTTNSTSGDMLLLDNLGRVVAVPTNEVPSALQPPSSIGVNQQIPNPTPGASMPFEIQERERAIPRRFRLFPATPPLLMPYLASQDEYGNTVIRPGALFFVDPLEGPVQGLKYWLSDYGFRYSLQQTITFASMTGVMKGANNLGYYTLNLKSKWAIFDDPGAGAAGWISSQVQAKTGVGSPDGDTQSAKSNLGTVTNPNGIWSSVNGVRVPELAWQQSLFSGHFVAVAGMVSQRNYIDANAYADTGRGKFINSALIHSGVMPLANYNFGLNLQWQPLDEWYAMAGGSMGGNSAGYAPWTDFSARNWSVPVEIGYAPRDLFGLGPGVYRIQPFAAEANGNTGGGLGFDLQQQLGANSPLGWFGRFGFGDNKVSGSASSQIGTGFVFQGPFKHILLQRTSNDLLGIGFVWSRPSATTKTVYHENEYTLETVYAMQLTPTIKLQPDFQVVWNPAFNKNNDTATVFQLQLVLAW